MTDLTEKTQMVLRELLTEPGKEASSGDVAGATGLPPTVAASLLARLISLGYVADRRLSDGARLYTVPMLKRADAAQAANASTTARPPMVQFSGQGQPTTSTRPVPTRRPAGSTTPVELPERELTGVWRLSELRAAADAGRVPADFLALVEREVAKTVKKTTRR